MTLVHSGHGSCGANGAGNVANCDFPRITICQIYSTLERANKNQTFEDLDISAATQEPAGVRLRVRHRSRHWMLGFASTLWLGWYQLLSVCSSNTDCSIRLEESWNAKTSTRWSFVALWIIFLLLYSEPLSKSCQNLVTRVQTKTKDILIYSIYFGFRYLHLFIILSGYNDTNTTVM